MEPAPETPAEAAVRQGLATSSPDRPPLAGRARSFWAGVLLGFLTLTLYYWYWQWQVFSEVHRQEGTRPRGWMVAVALAVSLVGGVLRYFAQRDGGPAGMDVAGLVLGVASTAFLTVYLVLETRGLDAALARHGLPRTGAMGWLVAFQALGTVLGPFLTDQGPEAGVVVAVLAVVLLGLLAYSILQAGLNRYWNALRLHPGPASPTGLSATAS